MSVLYVTQPGAEVRQKGARLRVEWQKQVLAALPVREIERLVLMGPVQLSAAATRLLLRAKIPVVFCSIRGRCYGTLSAGYEDAELLLTQVARQQNDAFRLNLARAFVDSKIRHQQRLLRRHARNHPNSTLAQTADELELLLKKLPGCRAIAEMMGMEGHASALYFAVFGACLRQEGVTFAGRNRRPPKDPVNAILSLGYMLVLQEVLSAIVAQGLHPDLGFLHEVSRRHPALGLDLLEMARQPIVDRLTLSLFNRAALTPGDFQESAEGGVRLREPSLKRYLEFYERTMTTPFRFGEDGQVGTFRDWLCRQASDLKKALQEDRTWTPILLEL